MRPRTGAAIAGAIALAIAAVPGTAPAAGPGETILATGLPVPPGAIAAGSSGSAYDSPDRIALSDDGRYVAFASMADALSPDAHPDLVNVYRKDRATGEVVLVSRADGPAGAGAAAMSLQPAISDDGSRVAFVTTAGLAPTDLDGQFDVYVRDVASGRTILATPLTADAAFSFDLSGDGQWVAFATAERLVLEDNNGLADVYRRGVGGGAPTLVSAADGAVTPGNGDSVSPSISDDGDWVAFATEATNLVPGFVNGNGADEDVFARDVIARRTHLVSSNGTGLLRGGNGESLESDVAGGPQTGRPETVVVAYSSQSTDIDADDADASASIFRRDGLLQARSALVSRATGPDGESASSRAHTPSVTDDGQRVAFSSDAPNLGAGADYYGAYARDVGAGTTALVSADNLYSLQATLSGDGGYVAWFDDRATTADADPDVAGVFGRAHATPPAALGAVEHLSRPAGAAPYLLPAVYVDFNDSRGRAISADGRWVAFVGSSRRLPGGATPDGQTRGQAYRRDTATGATDLVSRANGPDGAPADRAVNDATISADGTRVAFSTYASLDPADGDRQSDVYVRDLAAGTTTLASRASGPDGAPADDDAHTPAISAGGRHVVFLSDASNLGGPAGDRHVYVRDLAAHVTTHVSRATGGDGAAANNDAGGPAISGDGRVVAWHTNANNLDPDDPGPGFSSDVYARDLVAATTTLVSRRSGATGPKSTRSASDAAISDDGRVVAFEANDEALAPEGGPWGGSYQVVARDLSTHANALVSRAPGGAAADGYSSDPTMNADGSVIAFASYATNLLPGRGGSQRSAVFARTMATGELAGPPAFGLEENEPQNGAWVPSLSGDGQCLAFMAHGHAPFTGAAGDIDTLWIHVRPGGTCPKPLPEEPRARDPDRRDVPRGGDGAVAPTLRATLLRRRFRVGRARTAVAAARRGARGRARRRRATPAGTAFRLALSARANVTISFQRRAAGKRVGRQCRRPSRRLRRARACVRWVAVRPALARRGLDAGRRTVAFSGRIGRRALPRGSYRATVRAANAAGAARPVVLAFTIVRR